MKEISAAMVVMAGAIFYAGGGHVLGCVIGMVAIIRWFFAWDAK